jgi:hypothetical protein
MKSEYFLHMLSFLRIGEPATANVVVFADPTCSQAQLTGTNLQPWHIELVEEWLIKAKTDLLPPEDTP